MQRNIVCLSDIPAPLHDWLKHEKMVRSEAAGHRVTIYSIAVEALEFYKDYLEKQRAEQKEPVGVSGG